MKQRAITSVAILVATVVLVLFSHYIIYPIIVSILSVMAVYELHKTIGTEQKLVISIPAYILAAAFPTTAYFVTPEVQKDYILALAAALFVYLLYIMGVAIFSKGKILMSKIAEVFLCTTYACVSFSALALIRYLDRECGMFALGLVFIVAWIGDVAAFLVGSLIGRHKLIPEISPKKTVEGAIGAIVFAGLSFLLYGFIVDLIVEGMEINYIFLAIFGVLLSIVSQLGDLVASLIKREYGIKDYGKIFPGHGGIMDRFDSILAVSTVLLILCEIIPPFSF